MTPDPRDAELASLRAHIASETAKAAESVRCFIAQIGELEAEVERLRSHHAGLPRVAWGVVANAGRLSPERKARWSHVMDATGLGSTSARELCRERGFDGDENVGGRDEDDACTRDGPPPVAGLAEVREALGGLLFLLPVTLHREERARLGTVKRWLASAAEGAMPGTESREVLALRNVRALAASRIRKTDPENAAHLLRFCESAGVVGNILRGVDVATAEGARQAEDRAVVEIVRAWCDPDGLDAWKRDVEDVDKFQLGEFLGTLAHALRTSDTTSADERGGGERG